MRQNILALSMLTLSLLLAGCQQARPPVPTSATIDANKYYAVVLTNGALFFGHLEGLGSAFPVLHDVYVLVKRGKEWHGPDRMIINASSIVFVEPFGADSKVAQLIAQSQGK